MYESRPPVRSYTLNVTKSDKMRKKRSDLAENQERYLKEFVLARGLSSVALKRSELTRQTLHRWRDEPEFVVRESDAKEEVEAYYLDLLDKLARNGNVTAVIFALKALRPEKYDDALRRAKAEIQPVEAEAAQIILHAGPPPERHLRDWAEKNGFDIVPKSSTGRLFKNVTGTPIAT